MTATHVNGRKVVEDAPAPSPLSRDDFPVYFKQIRELLLDDGTVTYGCVHCDFTAVTAGKVRPHLKAHNGRGPGRPKTAVAQDVNEMSLADLLRRVRDLERVEAERDEWRRRALDAERRLNTLRRALNGGTR